MHIYCALKFRRWIPYLCVFGLYAESRGVRVGGAIWVCRARDADAVQTSGATGGDTRCRA